MIVYDFHLLCITIAPFKTNPPLIVNANAPLTFTFPFQNLKAV